MPQKPDDVTVKQSEILTLDLFLSLGAKFNPKKIFKVKGKGYSILLGSIELPFYVELEEGTELMAEFKVEKYGSPKFVAFRGFKTAYEGYSIAKQLSRHMEQEYEQGDNQELERILKDSLLSAVSPCVGVILCVMLGFLFKNDGSIFPMIFEGLAVLIIVFRKPLTLRKCKFYKDYGKKEFHEF